MYTGTLLKKKNLGGAPNFDLRIYQDSMFAYKVIFPSY